MISSPYAWVWCKAVLGAAIGAATVWFTFRGGHSDVSLMTGLVIAGAIAGLGLGAVVGMGRLKPPPIPDLPTGDWRDFFRRH